MRTGSKCLVSSCVVGVDAGGKPDGSRVGLWHVWSSIEEGTAAVLRGLKFVKDIVPKCWSVLLWVVSSVRVGERKT